MANGRLTLCLKCMLVCCLSKVSVYGFFYISLSFLSLFVATLRVRRRQGRCWRTEKMKMKSWFFLVCLALSFFGASTLARADDEITLGRTIVFKNTDYGAPIPLLVCRRVDAIKVKADRDMYLRKVVATFKNGETKTFRFYRNIKEDGTTRWRELPYKRCVKKLEVYGESKNSSAGVRVYGRT